MTTAQKALEYFRSNGVPRSREQIHAFCVVYTFADLCRELLEGRAALTSPETQERLVRGLQLFIGSVTA